ncbi:MAG TPA: hypothetical protein VFK41_11200 [Nocardioidaceae bacterium]|nr:hypothetical protein [Nocardioidaceae bacterium]
MLEELICRGHDVLDLGAGLRLKEGDSVDQDVGIREQLSSLRECRQRRPGFNRGLEDHFGLEIEACRRQRWQIVEGDFGTPGHVSALSTHPQNVLRIPDKLNTF